MNFFLAEIHVASTHSLFLQVCFAYKNSSSFIAMLRNGIDVRKKKCFGWLDRVSGEM